MDAIKGVLATVSGVLGPIFRTTGNIFSAACDVLSRMGSTIFILGFIGILFAFLWFLFRYLDKQQLTLPTVLFGFFFFVFLSGNLLILSQDAKTGNADEKPAAVVETQAAESAGDAAGDVKI